MPGRLFLFVGTAIVYRGYYGMMSPSLIQGRATNALVNGQDAFKFTKERMKKATTQSSPLTEKKRRSVTSIRGLQSYKRKRCPMLMLHIEVIPELVEAFGSVPFDCRA
jgi:hypothetical protein